MADEDNPLDWFEAMIAPVELGFALAEAVLAGVVEPVEEGSGIATMCGCCPDVST